MTVWNALDNNGTLMKFNDPPDNEVVTHRASGSPSLSFYSYRGGNNKMQNVYSAGTAQAEGFPSARRPSVAHQRLPRQRRNLTLHTSALFTPKTFPFSFILLLLLLLYSPFVFQGRLSLSMFQSSSGNTFKCSTRFVLKCSISGCSKMTYRQLGTGEIWLAPRWRYWPRLTAA